MKYFILLVTLCFLLSSSVSRNNIEKIVSTDSLKKYSYFLVGYTVNDDSKNSVLTITPFTGTGFFYRKGKTLFFVTAKHLVSGCIGQTKINIMDSTVYVWLADENGNPDKQIPINIKKTIDTTRCLSFEESPDVIAIPVEDNRLSNVRSVEKFISPEFKKVREIEIFGFPENRNDDYRKSLYTHVSNIHIPQNTYQIAIRTNTTTGITDKFSYYIFTDSIPIDDKLHGYSGSPVFVKDSASNRWRLMGVHSGHSDSTAKENDRYLSFVRLQFLLTDIKNKTR